MKTVDITDYTVTPGGRSRIDGDFSGEEFRIKYLEPFFDSNTEGELVVVLDGTRYGYPPSFVEEAFGGLARKYGASRVLGCLRLVSKENSLLIDEIMSYING